MLHKIELTNFKQHKNLVVEFGAGLNVIRGDNGSGKSTILKAILYALFGANAAGAKEHLTHWDGGTMSVDLDITLPTHGRVLISRGLRKATVTRGDEIMASGQTPVSSFVERHLGMSGKVLKNLLCAEQGEAQGLINMGAAGLQAQLETISRAELIDKVLSFTVADVALLNGELRGIGEVADLNKLQDEVEAANGNASRLKSLTEQMKISTESAKTAWLDQQRKLDQDLRPLQILRDRLQARLSSANAQLKALEKGIADTGEPSPELIKKLEHETASLRGSIGEYEADLREAETHNMRYDSLKTRLDTTIKAHSDLLEKRPAVDEVLQLAAASKEAASRVVEADKLVDIAKSAVSEAACPTCKRPFSDEALEKANEQLAQAEAHLSEMRTADRIAFDDLIHTQKTYGLSVSLVKTLESKLSDAQDSISELSKELEGMTPVDLAPLRTTLHNLRDLLPQKLAELSVLKSKAEDYAHAKKKHEELVDSIGQIREEMRDIPASLDHAIEVAARNANENRHLFDTSSKELQTLQEQLSKAEGSLQAVSSLLERETEKAERHRNVKNDLHYRIELQKFLRQNRSKLIQDAWDSLTNYASYLIDVTTEGLINNLVRSNSGDFSVKEAERQVPVTELSGARKSIVGLCLRIALAKLFYGDSGFTLLDEVSSEMDEANATRMGGMLTALSSQVVLVSHRQGESFSATQVIQL